MLIDNIFTYFALSLEGKERKEVIKKKKEWVAVWVCATVSLCKHKSLCYREPYSSHCNYCFPTLARFLKNVCVSALQVTPCARGVELLP